MKKELQEILYKSFPDLYKQRKLSIMESCMPWGFDCGDGWFDLIYNLSENISLIDPTVEAVQVKEKFGGLRFYINHGSEEVYKLIDAAEEISFTICENCGSSEGVKTTEEGWITTLCDKCLQKG